MVTRVQWVQRLLGQLDQGLWGMLPHVHILRRMVVDGGHTPGLSWLQLKDDKLGVLVGLFLVGLLPKHLVPLGRRGVQAGPLLLLGRGVVVVPAAIVC